MSAWSVAFSPNGERVASGSSDHTVRIWDAATGQLQRELKGHSNIVWSVAFSPNGKRVASGSSDKTVQIWKKVNGMKIVKQLRLGHEVPGWARSIIRILQSIHTHDIFISKIVEYCAPCEFNERVIIGKPTCW